MIKICTACKVEKSLDCFHSNPKYRLGVTAWCKLCTFEKTHAYYEANKERLSANRRAKYKLDPTKVQASNRKRYDKMRAEGTYSNWKYKEMLRNIYGLSLEDFEYLLNKQNRLCGICKSDNPGKDRKRWCVDHNHQTGKVRGILCWRCNSFLGQVEAGLVKPAMAYLEAFSPSSNPQNNSILAKDLVKSSNNSDLPNHFLALLSEQTKQSI